MISITDDKKCTGCTACKASCPKDAISVTNDERGFKRPVINFEKCIECGICQKVCPANKPPERNDIRESYAVKHVDKEVLKQSTSGGIFTAISDYILKAGGVIYGAAFDENMIVRHIRATTTNERNRMRGSKYVQSDIGETFTLIKKDLKDNVPVLFCGTPCQVAGLKSYLEGKDDGLICLDLICHGVPSPMIFDAHLKLLSKKLRTKIEDYKFRPKKWGWHIHREIAFGTKKEYHTTPYTDLWRNLYYSRVATRTCCSICPYSSLERVGDITIGDCRGIDKIMPDFGSYDGVTLAIVNSQKGRVIFESIKDQITFCDVDLTALMQQPLCKPSHENKNSDKFFSDYNKYGYKKAIKNHYGLLYPVKYYIKKLLKLN